MRPRATLHGQRHAAALFIGGFVACFGLAGMLAGIREAQLRDGDLAAGAGMLVRFVLICIGVVAYIALGAVPGLVANARRHPNATAITACGWIGLLIWPAWFVGLIWALTNPPQSDQRQGSTPGPYRIEGIDRATGMDTSIVVTAASAENARVKAELRGVVVTAVRRVEGATSLRAVG